VSLTADGIGIIEQNFDFDLLSPAKMMEKAVGHVVTIVRTNPATGAETREQAEVLADNDGAILKIGIGGSTLTVAKNIRQLGLELPMLTSIEDLAVFRPVAEILGERFLFVAAPSQVYEGLPEGPLKKAISDFLGPWKAKYGERDPNWAGRGWDAVMLTVAAIQKSGSFQGSVLRDTIESIRGFQGTTGVYQFSPDNHQGITQNPLALAVLEGGKVKILK
jgi:branched-chain amino acid transport system substrate-binding protein